MFTNGTFSSSYFSSNYLSGTPVVIVPIVPTVDTSGRGGFNRGAGGPGSSYGTGNLTHVRRGFSRG
jgi:hypothetical protein